MLRKVCGSLAVVLFLVTVYGAFSFPPSWDNGSREDPFQAGRLLTGTPQAAADPVGQLLVVIALAFLLAAIILFWPQIGKSFWYEWMEEGRHLDNLHGGLRRK